MADMEEVIGKEWKVVEIERRRRSKRQRKDLRGGGWVGKYWVGHSGKEGCNRYEEDTIGAVGSESLVRRDWGRCQKCNFISLSRFL